MKNFLVQFYAGHELEFVTSIQAMNIGDALDLAQNKFCDKYDPEDIRNISYVTCQQVVGEVSFNV